MKPICKNCQYWEKVSKELSNDYGKYAGFCSCDKFVYTGSNEKKMPKDGLGYADYEQYSADFATGEDFGCIHFEPKKK